MSSRICTRYMRPGRRIPHVQALGEAVPSVRSALMEYNAAQDAESLDAGKGSNPQALVTSGDPRPQTPQRKECHHVAQIVFVEKPGDEEENEKENPISPQRTGEAVLSDLSP